jgi:uncharacterized protein YbjT (DUF2867 family)
MNFFIIGATGGIGHEAILRLLAAGSRRQPALGHS